MKKIYIVNSLILFLLIFSSCNDDSIVKGNNTNTFKNLEKTFLNEGEANQIASKFIVQKGINDKVSLVCNNITSTENPTNTKNNRAENITYYVYNIGERGYVIVSADKSTLPILGYSLQSKFDRNSVSLNVLSFLKTYEEQIKTNRENGVLPMSSKKSSYEISYNQSVDSISPLLGTIAWSQNFYYNAKCPEKNPVGCVAIAASQIMRYYKYPSKSIGYSSYRHNKYGKLSFDHNYVINWNAMQESNLKEENQEIAKFCYGVAVGLGMKFTPKGSSALQSKVPRVLKDHYYYPNTLKSIYRIGYTHSKWSKTILNELRDGRPVQFAGYSKSFFRGGHSFICDGYKREGDSEFFHFNWGHGGYFDGYFLMSALDPLSSGKGYNYNQQAVIGFAPPINKIVSGGIYELRPASSLLKNLDVSGSKTLQGTNVGVYMRNSSINQRWRIFDMGNNSYKLTPINAMDKVLTVSNQVYKNGKNVEIWSDKNTKNQRWELAPLGNGSFYRISPVSDPLSALNAVFETEKFRNATLHEGYTISASQKWKLVRVQ